MQRKSQEAEGEETQADGSHGWPMAATGSVLLGRRRDNSTSCPTPYRVCMGVQCRLQGPQRDKSANRVYLTVGV